MVQSQFDITPEVAPAVSEASANAIPGDLLAEAGALVAKLTEWRHELHRIPELSNDTPQTSAYIQARLAELGIPFRTLVDGNCVVGLVGLGAKVAAADGTAADGECGNVIMLRGDMDALPVAEESGEPFASTNGCMHACGHDMHATALLGAACILKAHEDEICELGGTVKLLFQPGEETFQGARAAIVDGLLEQPKPAAGFAMHVNSQSPIGLVLYGNPALSGVYGFRITLQGKGGHGSSPDICIDPITAGVHVHLALQELVSREVSAMKEIALTVGKFAGGAAANTIPDSCVLEGTMRGFDDELMAHLRERIAEVVEGVAKTYRVESAIETISDVPPLVLDERMTEVCRGYLGAVEPKLAFLPLFHAMASEDYALISKEVPSAYFTVGAAARDTDEHYAQHHPKVRFDDAELPLGAAAYAAVAFGWLADKAASPSTAG
jgi:amidohydrolase